MSLYHDQVENNRTNLLVILAGYKDKMQGLLNADPGLPRRFPNQAVASSSCAFLCADTPGLQVHLADYSPAELALIAEVGAFLRAHTLTAPGARLQPETGSA